MTLEEYKKKLEFIAEKLAYLAFTDTASALLEDRGVTEQDIKNFDVLIFFSNVLDENNKVKTECIIRFSVFIEGGNEITFVFNNDIVKQALIDKMYDSQFDKAYVQHHTFNFGKPNTIELYDAQFILEKRLGLEGQEW